jgi:predicted PolB exonuclease-like 3'-5' exonuclease
MNIYLDLETIPAQNPKAITSLRLEAEKEKLAIKAPSNYKDQAKIDEYIAAKRIEIDADFEQRYRKTSFDGAVGQIVVASYAIDDNEPMVIYASDWKDSEQFILTSLYESLQSAYSPNSQMRPVFIGHNIVNFDLRFLLQRSIVVGVKPPMFIPFKAKPWDDVVFDTMTAWAGVGNRVSMAKLCEVFGIDSKGSEVDGDIDGSKVWDYVQAGRIDDVATYCMHDVIRTRQIYKRINFLK